MNIALIFEQVNTYEDFDIEILVVADLKKIQSDMIVDKIDNYCKVLKQDDGPYEMKTKVLL